MAYFRKVKRVVKWLPMRGLATVGTYILTSKDSEKATDKVVKAGGMTRNTHYYWVAEESYREGKKVKSRHLYSFDRLVEKPTLDIIKKIRDEEAELCQFYRGKGKYCKCAEESSEKSLEKVVKLEYLLTKMDKDNLKK